MNDKWVNEFGQSIEDLENERFLDDMYMCANCEFNDCCNQDPDEYGLCKYETSKNI